MSDVTMSHRARFLASKGFAVFPVFTIDGDRCSCGKDTCTSPGKHPIGNLVPSGVKEATTDPQYIMEWWSLYPDANIGIATGDVSGIVVLDIDVKTGGDETLSNLEDRFDMLPDTWSCWTGSGGAHFYFRMPPADIRNSAGSVGPGIDVRGNGGYVIAPPSKHISGGSYSWNAKLHPKLIPMADVPTWLFERMEPKTVTANRAKPLPRKIGQGERNNWLTSAAGTMRQRGFCEEAMYAALSIENARRCDPPLNDVELRRIARSVERYPPDRVLRISGKVA